MATAKQSPLDAAIVNTLAGEPVVKLYRSDMMLIERAVRGGWPMTAKELAGHIEHLQAVLNDSDASDRDRWRARRTLELCNAKAAASGNAPIQQGHADDRGHY
jgi:hypothetical protein